MRTVLTQAHHLTAGTGLSIKIETMPTYEYVCSKCGHEFERFQSISDPPLTVCPKELCAQKKWGRGRLKKKIGAGAGLLFKGSGFYITDYRSDKYKEAAKKESSAGSSGEGKPAAGKADSKPASKSEGKPTGKS